MRDNTALIKDSSVDMDLPKPYYDVSQQFMNGISYFRESYIIHSKFLKIFDSSTISSKPNHILYVDCKDEIASILSAFDYIEDHCNKIWENLDKAIKQHPQITVFKAFYELVLDNSVMSNIKCCIADYLCSFDVDETIGYGLPILSSLLKSDDEDVLEYAVILADNWQDKESLVFLKEAKPKSERVKNYINDVITEIKEA